MTWIIILSLTCLLIIGWIIYDTILAVKKKNRGSKLLAEYNAKEMKRKEQARMNHLERKTQARMGDSYPVSFRKKEYNPLKHWQDVYCDIPAPTKEITEND